MGIAVVIPVYNVEQYLEECLESVVNQTVPFEQIVLVNDGSTDGSLAICRKYQEANTNIEVIDQKNEGQGIARNTGLSLVHSTYVMFLDSDDYIVRDTVEKVLYEMESEKLDVLYFDSDIKNELREKKKNIYDRVNKIVPKVMTGRAYFLKYYPDYYVVSPCMICIRTMLLKEKNIYFPQIKKHEDNLFSIKVVLNAQLVKYVPYKLYMRRYRENSVMTTANTCDTWKFRCQAIYACWEYMSTNLDRSIKDEEEMFKLYLLATLCELLGIYSTLKDDADERAYEELQRKFCGYWEKSWKINLQNSTFFVKKLLYGLLWRLTETSKVISEHMAENLPKMLQYTKNMYEQELKQILGDIPLNQKGLRIGIYGTGAHTENLLLWYKHFFKEINCDMFFIDTYKKTNEMYYMDRPVININDASLYVDQIVVSSFDYEAEMIDKIKHLFGEQIPVKRFYDRYKAFIFMYYKSCYEVDC